MSGLGVYGLIALVGAIVTLLATPAARRLSMKIGYSAQPDERKVHQIVTPYGGGCLLYTSDAADE